MGAASAISLGDPLEGLDLPPSATGVLIIDLEALIRNYFKLRDEAAPAECAAVVKGIGYGLGACEVASALFANGCRTFFVATLSEGETLREALPDSVIYVLDGLLPGSGPDFAGLGLRPVLGDMAEIEEWARFCQINEQKLPAALHADTGMNRLGLKAADQQRLIEKPERLDAVSISLLMSHLACADEPERRENALQRERFVRFAANIPSAPLSLANSAGIFLGPEFCFDLVRPGIALYGGNPFSKRTNPMEQVVSLYGRVLQIGEAQTGETVGYGGAFQLKRPTNYATVAVGYADGYLFALGSSDKRSGAPAYFRGQPLPILGRVSMDLIVFDITDQPQNSIHRGDFVELIGPHFTVDDTAAFAGTIAYEILTSLGPRYTRIYRGGLG